MNNTGLPSWVKVANGSKSFPCPHCGGNTAVGDSRPSHNGIRRRRYCKCGHRLTTYEVEAEHFPQNYTEYLTNIAIKVAMMEVNLSELFKVITAATMAFNHEEGAKHGIGRPSKPDHAGDGGTEAQDT